MIGYFRRTLRRTLRWFRSGGTAPQAIRDEATAREEGTFHGTGLDRERRLEADYHAAVALLKERMDQAHPADCHRKLSVPGASSYDYGERRMDVVDDASTAIAMALREGASVPQAAEVWASKIGI